VNGFITLRSYEFENPKKIVFGIDAIEKIGREAKRFGKNVFFVSDQNIEKLGLTEKVIKLLEKEGLKATTYMIPVSEPTAASTRAIANVIREGKYDVVIGLGGGSVLDSAKLAAVMATNPGDVLEYCVGYGGKPVKNKTLPKILLPTTAGTGSEVSNTLVIIEGKYKTWITDNKILAEVAIVDPALTLSLPPRTTANTGMDALSHVGEAFMSLQSNPISDALSLEAIRLVAGYLRRAYYCGDDIEARWAMSHAAMIGGWVIGFPWIGGPAILGHCIAEAMGSMYNLPHGLACALALPYVMEFNLPAIQERLKVFAIAMGENISGLPTREAAFKSVEAVIRLMKDLEMPISLKDVNIPKEHLHEFADYIINERQYMYDLPHLNPRKLTRENLNQLLEKMWEGAIG
jgi:alcohol dehydrogenase class IV